MARLPNYNPEEHTPRLEDAFMTRREMLRRTGMGMGHGGISDDPDPSNPFEPFPREAIPPELVEWARSGHIAPVPVRWTGK